MQASTKMWFSHHQRGYPVNKNKFRTNLDNTFGLAFVPFKSLPPARRKHSKFTFQLMT